MPTVKELKDNLRKKGLKVSGNKDELENRLKEYNQLPKKVLDKALYMKARDKVKKRVKVWPSAYASGQVVTEYKKMGGKYKGTKSLDKGIGRWFHGEKWVNVCNPKKGGKYQPCGRKSRPNLKKYPYCRPSKRANSQTPMTVDEINKKYGEKYLKKLCKIKRQTGLPKRGKSQNTNIILKH